MEKPLSTTWKERFEEKFPYWRGGQKCCQEADTKYDIQSFIESLLEEERKALLDTLAERVEEVAGDCSKEGDICDFCDGHPPCEYRMGRQRATEKVLSIIKSLSVK